MHSALYHQPDAQISYICILKAYLHHVSIQVYHFHGKQNASF